MPRIVTTHEVRPPAKSGAFSRARAGGVTTIQILPGSANLIGGEATILKLRPSRTLQGMRFEDAPPAAPVRAQDSFGELVSHAPLSDDVGSPLLQLNGAGAPLLTRAAASA